MATGTRSNTLQELKDDLALLESRSFNRIDKVEIGVNQIKEQMKELQLSMTQMLNTWEKSTKEKESCDSSHKINQGSQGKSHRTSENHKSFSTHLPKLYFPKFDGDGARGWVRKCLLFFKFQPMVEEEKIDFAAMHFEGRAELWYQSYVIDKPCALWDEFVIDLLSRFETRKGDGIIGEFKLLKQQGSVDEYFEGFEELRSLVNLEVPNLPESYLVGNFIGGLKDEIKAGVRRFAPTTIAKAVELARLEESIVENKQAKFKLFSKNNYTPIQTTYNTQAKSYSPTTETTYQTNQTLNKGPATNPVNNQQKGLLPTPNTPLLTLPPPVRRLTQAQIQQRKQAGLCIYCDDKWYQIQHAPGIRKWIFRRESGKTKLTVI